MAQEGPEPGPNEPPSDGEALDVYSQVVARVAETVLPSVASLYVSGRRGQGGGSASVLSSDWLLLTSAHVVEGARRQSG